MKDGRIHASTRREFLDAAGAGLLIVAAAPPAESQPGPRSGTLEARLRIGADGRFTLLTGKIEEGQGARTELAMAAAEELRVPLALIDVVLGDTEQVPNDGITAGSRTTPFTLPLVRRAAAAARELLAEAAARHKRPKLTYQELARLPELAQAYSRPLPPGVSVTPAREWRVMGTPQIRLKARDIVTGAHRFPSDIERPGMLYGCVLRPPSFGAALASVDLDAARKLPDVTVVREDGFVGCAAPTSWAARKAVEALAATARWNEGQHPSSDGIFDYLKAHAQPGGRGSRPSIRGDVERALAGAGRRLAALYTTAYIQHAPLEPRAAVAEWRNGRLTVWTGTSNPFSVRDQLAQAFQMPADRVRVIVPDMGGGFGGKHTGEAALEAARLAREAKRPVSLRWTRAEEFTWAYFRPAARIEIEAALDGSNGILAWDFVNYNSGGAAIEAPYRAPHYRTRYVPCDSPLRQGSYRALAATANNFAREAFIDELAAAAGADPLEFRLANLDNERIRAVLTAAAEKFGWAKRSRRRQANRGVGLACGTEKNSVVAACVEVEVDPRTGVPKLIEICQAFECGAIVNPANLQAQVEGCILMGLGAALREEILFANGRLKNGRFAAYRVTRFRDMPKMDILLVDKKDAEPVGAGETPIMAVAPAMANAIFAATGQRVRSMPLRPKPPGKT